MLILPQQVYVKWNYNNKEWYESKSFTFPGKCNTLLLVNVQDIYPGSKVPVNLECDYCGERFMRNYNLHVNNNGSDACSKCRYKKTKNTVLVKYGVDNVFKIPEVKEKSKQTLMNNFGVENPFESPIIQDKIKDTLLKKYNVDNPLKSKEIRDRGKETNLLKYGAEYYIQTEEGKNKYKGTCQEKYGCDNTFQNEGVKEKIKQTNLNKYGVEHVMQNKNILEKAQNTNIIRYGDITPLTSEIIKEKIIQTNLKKYGCKYTSQYPEFIDKKNRTIKLKYGVDNISQHPDIKEKKSKIYYKYNSISTSTQQLYIYNLLKENGYNVDLNYPLSRINMDVALFISVFKIDIEYDAWYWHQDQQKDRRRDEFAKSQGWKILRIKSSHKLPTLEQIEESIDYLINKNKSFSYIILDDWKETSGGY